MNCKTICFKRHYGTVYRYSGCFLIPLHKFLEVGYGVRVHNSENPFMFSFDKSSYRVKTFVFINIKHEPRRTAYMMFSSKRTKLVINCIIKPIVNLFSCEKKDLNSI